WAPRSRQRWPGSDWARCDSGRRASSRRSSCPPSSTASRSGSPPPLSGARASAGGRCRLGDRAAAGGELLLGDLLDELQQAVVGIEAFRLELRGGPLDDRGREAPARRGVRLDPLGAAQLLLLEPGVDAPELLG